MLKRKVDLANAFLLLPIAIVLSDLVVQLHSDSTQNPFTRQFFMPSLQRTQEMRSGLNAQNDQQPFRTVTMNGGQQFVLVPRRLFLQNRKLFAYRRRLPSPSKFRIGPKIGSNSDPNLNQMPMPKKVPNSNWMVKSNPKQHALPIAVSAKNANSVQQSNSFVASADGTKSGFLPRLTNAGIRNSAPQILPSQAVMPQKVSLLRPPAKPRKIRPPISEISASVESKLAEMSRKREEFFKKQRKELQMMRERIGQDRRRMEMERRHRILADKEKRNRKPIRLLAREQTLPMAFDTRRPQQLQQPLKQQMPPVVSTTSRLPPSLASPVAAPAAAPPGQLPPNDQVIDQLNNALDFMDVASRLRLSGQFRTRKVHANV